MVFQKTYLYHTDFYPNFPIAVKTSFILASLSHLLLVNIANLHIKVHQS